MAEARREAEQVERLRRSPRFPPHPELRARGPAGGGAVDPARRRDRGPVQGHVAADRRGRRPQARRRPGRPHPRPLDQRLRRRRPDRLHPFAACSPPPTTPTRSRASSPTRSATSPAATSSGCRKACKVATGIMILSMLLGAAAMAAGAGEAGMGVLAAGQQAAMGKFLAFSRTQESSADAAGAGFLAKSQTNGKGLLSFFKKLQNQEFRYAIPQDNGYTRTHPLTGERIAALEQIGEERARLERRHRPEARGPLPARQGQAFRLCRGAAAHPASPIPRATRASRRAMPGPMPGTRAPIRTRRWPRPTACSPSSRTIPISSS